MGRYIAKKMADGNAETEAEAVEELAAAPGTTVLVLGFGPGVGVALLAARGIDVVGVDPSAVMVEEARRRAPTARLLRATADRLDLADASVDGAIAVNSIQLWKPFEASVAEVARVLRPGARLVTYTHDWAIKMSTRREADDWVAHAAAVCAERGLVDARSWRAQAEDGRSVAFCATRAAC